MKINELIVENEQLDELNLKGLGTGLGKAIGGAAGGVVQGAKNVWSGMKQGYAGAQQALAPDNSGSAGTAPATGGQSAPKQSPAATSAGATDANVAGGEVASNNLLARAKQGTTQDPNAQQPATAPAEPAPAQQPAAAEPAAPAANAAPAAVDMKAGEIVKGLQDVWGKATASQGSQTAAPAVQQQIKAMAKAAGMTGQTVEGRVKFNSKFLGMEI